MAPLPLSPSTKLASRLAGWVCFLAFFGISTAHDSFFVGFHPPFTRVDQGEANFWLAAAYLLTPASLLLGLGYGEWLADWTSPWSRRLEALSDLNWRAWLAGLTALAAILAHAGNAFVLLGYPITDDEWAARFGGQVLASGKVLVELPMPTDVFPTLFMWVKGTSLTSMDWLGTQAAWALAEVTHSGTWLFALSAALTVPPLAWVLARRLSRSWALAGAVLAVTSPMAFTMSMSTHGHLHSRALFAWTLALVLWGREQPSVGRGVLSGLALGASFITRPFETAFLAAPFIVLEAWEALRERGARIPWLAGAGVGWLLPVLLMVAHSHAVTGGWLPPRHSEGHTGAVQSDIALWVKFGSNSAFNALRLGVWFAGPLGVFLCAAGALTDSFTRRLGAGVLSVLGLGLFHDNFGIHAVGPIHYSECVVPLTVLAVHGLHRLAPFILPSAATVALLIGNLTFNAVQATSLHGQALIQADIYDALEAAVPESSRPAVVLAPQFSKVWHVNDAFNRRGSWVFDWRRPKPDFSDDILILHDRPGAVEVVRQAFPERTILRLKAAQGEALLRVTPVTAP